MSDHEMSKETRKVTDVLLSLEEKIILLIKTISANDMNNKLILDRLNKLVSQGNVSVPTTAETVKVSESSKTITAPNQSPIELSEEPVKPRKQFTFQPIIESANTASSSSKEKKEKSVSKIPVGQRITDNNGKDLFMADVVVKDLTTGEVAAKLKTNAVGKWQAYLGAGNYSVHVSKITDANTMHKIESLQEIEVNAQAKSLQLPLIIIKR
jgi:hypothetical protein